MEIERKFLIRQLPADFAAAPSHVIVQGYLALTDDGVEVRVRRKANAHYLTVKKGAGLSRHETEIRLSKAQFDELWPLTTGRRLRKSRSELSGPAGTTIEVDIYHDVLAGLQVAEVEFPDEATAHTFLPPDWFGREITGDPTYRNETLTRLGLPTELSFTKT